MLSGFQASFQASPDKMFIAGDRRYRWKDFKLDINVSCSVALTVG